MIIKNVPIGKLIQEILEEQKMSVIYFAKEIGRDRSTVYDIFKRKNIDTDTLRTISRVLKYNFFLNFVKKKNGKNE
jgi:predicted transcriptional regulator